MSMASDAALNAGDITKIGVGVIVGLVIIGFLLSLLLTAIVARVVIAVVVIVLAAIVWQQRSSIEDHIHRHNCNMSFFGVHLDPPANLTRFCG